MYLNTLLPAQPALLFPNHPLQKKKKINFYHFSSLWALVNWVHLWIDFFHYLIDLFVSLFIVYCLKQLSAFSHSQVNPFCILA